MLFSNSSLKPLQSVGPVAGTPILENVHHSMKQILSCISFLLLTGCVTSSTPQPLAALPNGCESPGTNISAELPQPSRAYSYTYQVYLPPCYTAESESFYPVLYLIPGRSSASGAWFAAGLTDIVDRIILNEEIPPFIIVATENTESDPFGEIIANALVPAVKSQYPVIDNRQYRAVAGGSLGGIAAYRLAFQHPGIFSSAGIFGAGAISGEETRIKEWLSAMNDKNLVRVFMDTGDEDPLMLERAEAMKSLLDEMGIENQLHSGHGGHNYAYWVSNFEIYLRWLAKDW
jgi:enterochelin esterase-like enzyme